jgi:hypothetical protein
MRSFAPCLALMLSGCAAHVWDARVFDCDRVQAIELTGGSVVVYRGEGSADEDCRVEVTGLRGLDVDDGTLSGEGFSVVTNRDLFALDLSDTSLSLVTPDLTIEVDRVDLEWDPFTEALEATVSARQTLTVVGDVSQLTLAGQGEAVVALLPEGARVEGTIGELQLAVAEPLGAVDLTVDIAELQLPIGPRYQAELDAPRAWVDPRLDVEGDGPEVSLAVSASVELLVRGPGAYREADITCKGVDIPDVRAVTSLRATHVRFDAADTSRPSDVYYESHRLDPLEEMQHFGEVLTPANSPQSSDSGRTWFFCGPFPFSLGGGPQHGMSYLLRVYDGESLVDCYAHGHDPEAMVTGTYAPDHVPGRDDISPEACAAFQADLPTTASTEPVP